MLQSRHFAGKPLTGKGLKRFPGTLHSGVQYPPTHHIGVRRQNKKQNQTAASGDSFQYITGKQL
jgi:hypothetical protein